MISTESPAGAVSFRPAPDWYLVRAVSMARSTRRHAGLSVVGSPSPISAATTVNGNGTTAPGLPFPPAGSRSGATPRFPRNRAPSAYSMPVISRPAAPCFPTAIRERAARPPSAVKMYRAPFPKARAPCSTSGRPPSRESRLGYRPRATGSAPCSEACAGAGTSPPSASAPGPFGPSSPSGPRMPESRVESPGIRSGSGPLNRSPPRARPSSICRLPGDGRIPRCRRTTPGAPLPAVAPSRGSGTGRAPNPSPPRHRGARLAPTGRSRRPSRCTLDRSPAPATKHGTRARLRARRIRRSSRFPARERIGPAPGRNPGVSDRRGLSRPSRSSGLDGG